MSETMPSLWLIPALPLAASVVTAFMSNPPARRFAHLPCILGALGSCILSFMVLAAVIRDPAVASGWKQYYTWFHAGNVNVGFTLRADALTAIMLATVTFISTLIAIYSVGYMHGDEGYARFFAEVALFIFSMTGLVLADNFLLLYAFWEGVGLCSYLLIGFWFTKPSAANAARKAFLVTRLGDLGLILGIILMWTQFGYHLDFDSVFPRQVVEEHSGIVTAVCLLFFCGCVGKSAQFPLYVWLPDAMEGPTPVSALIHAATMVTAGVYLVARCMPFYSHAPVAQVVVAGIGAFTALLAAVIAMTQTDLKRVLAYSTISQLGYMFMALGSGAAVAGIFHLFTHAFFKALLFLAAGSVMHAMGNVIDMRRFGGLRRLLPITHATFLCGAAALASFPFITSGFWSKDEVLSGILQAAYGEHHDYAIFYYVVFAGALLTAALTAFYTFRAYFLTFWGPERVPEEAGHHAHEAPPVMTIPLIILAVGAIAVGFVNAQPLTGWLDHFLPTTPYMPAHHGAETSALARTALWAGSITVALAGIALAGWIYVARPGVAERWARALDGLYEASRNKFYVDEIYDALIVKPIAGFAEFCRLVDLHLLDSLVDLIGQVPRFVGLVFRPIQNGLVQFYALAMILGLAVLLLALVRAVAG